LCARRQRLSPPFCSRRILSVARLLPSLCRRFDASPVTTTSSIFFLSLAHSLDHTLRHPSRRFFVGLCPLDDFPSVVAIIWSVLPTSFRSSSISGLLWHIKTHAHDTISPRHVSFRSTLNAIRSRLRACNVSEQRTSFPLHYTTSFFFSSSHFLFHFCLSSSFPSHILSLSLFCSLSRSSRLLCPPSHYRQLSKRYIVGARNQTHIGFLLFSRHTHTSISPSRLVSTPDSLVSFSLSRDVVVEYTREGLPENQAPEILYCHIFLRPFIGHIASFPRQEYSYKIG